MRYLCVAGLLFASCFALAQADDRFDKAEPKYAPDRQFDLIHVAVTLDVDWPKRTFTGSSTNSVKLLADVQSEIRLHAGQRLSVDSVEVDGAAVKFRRDGGDLWIAVGGKAEQERKITVKFHSKSQSGGGFLGGGGWHWIEPHGYDANRIGFWTQGETEYNRDWAPTWDYPNDFATSETTTTVPADWTVVGNGVLAADKTANGRRTMRWVMKQPHATYLISLVGGPLEYKKDKWEDRELWYVVPKGYAHLIDPSFGDTKDMLTFFSNRVGFKYLWPKYAQNAMHDFGGGMENVSSTTLGMDALTDPREGFRTMSGLNAHELAHQWFGDTVSCRDWGHIWLNESFATFMQGVYFEHSQGKNEYERQIAGYQEGYFGESRRYRRPLATNKYPDGDSMFDSHAYPKGASILHTLRRQLGDAKFFAGLSWYLNKYQLQPVQSWNLQHAFAEASGVNCEPFFQQWIFKPGHPVLDVQWSYDEAAKEAKLTVKQVQDTSNGTPIYSIPSKVSLITKGKTEIQTVKLSKVEETFTFKASSKPDVVLLDPDRDFLREMKQTFTRSEDWAIAEFGTNAVDRVGALVRLTETAPSASEAYQIGRLLSADSKAFAVFTSYGKLAEHKVESLRPIFIADLKHPDQSRRLSAVQALGKLGGAEKELAGVVTESQFFAVSAAAIGWLDGAKNAALLLEASKWATTEGNVNDAAIQKLVAAKHEKAGERIMALAQSPQAPLARIGLRHIGNVPSSDATRKVLKKALTSEYWPAVNDALTGWAVQKDPALLSEVEALTKAPAPDRIQKKAKEVLGKS